MNQSASAKLLAKIRAELKSYSRKTLLDKYSVLVQRNKQVGGLSSKERIFLELVPEFLHKKSTSISEAQCSFESSEKKKSNKLDSLILVPKKKNQTRALQQPIKLSPEMKFSDVQNLNQTFKKRIDCLKEIQAREIVAQDSNRIMSATRTKIEWVLNDDEREKLFNDLLRKFPRYWQLDTNPNSDEYEIAKMQVISNNGRIKLGKSIRYMLISETTDDKIEVIVEEIHHKMYIALHLNSTLTHHEVSEHSYLTWRLIELNSETLFSFEDFESYNEQIISPILADTQIQLKEPLPDRKIELTRFCGQLNASQKRAVFLADANPLTLIRGPPGTGKTSTACGLIKSQIPLLRSKERILMTADSNQAVMRICESLAEKNIPFLHVVSLSVLVSPRVHHYADFRHHMISFRKINIWRKYRKNKKFKKLLARAKNLINTSLIICCTIAMSKSLSESKEFRKFKFPMTIVDEASQTPEIKLLSAMKTETQKMVLIGDEKQLSPVVLDKTNIALGYGSIFERLAKNKNNQILMLDTQYRMHPALAENFSNLFYDGKVKSGVGADARFVEPSLRSIFLKWEKNPWAFINIESSESKFKLSYYNQDEVIAVTDYLRKFFNYGIQGSKIGVIATYAEQVSRLQNSIRASLPHSFSSTLKVETVDSFQGSELDYILVSLVRSNTKREIGFLQDTRRLNVAISRQKRGLLIFGNASTLKASLSFSALIRKSKKVGTFTTFSEEST